MKKFSTEYVEAIAYGFVIGWAVFGVIAFVWLIK